MKSLADTCDHERLEGFLRGDLSTNAEWELTRHLDECLRCRQQLEQLAAGASAWDEAGMFLKPHAFHELDEAETSAERSHQPLQIQNVLYTLGPTDDPEMLGRLGGYEVSGVVGAGAMGVVLKALDKSLERTVAIKVMAPHLAAHGAARKRFAREAKAAAAILHPNVMAIHSVSHDERLPYLVMPYVGGSSLQKRLDDDSPLPLVEVLRIGSQIAHGLQAAHAQGLVHRDIKPANILLENGVERVAITDFGLARAVDDATMTRSGAIAGTPQYMSPEQARGEAVDQRSDLFSLGSVLYTMCTGRPPFRAETSYGILRRITDTEPRSIREINPDIPKWLCGIIGRLMAKRADDRFESAEEVAELLEDCLAHVQQPTVVALPERAEQLSQLLPAAPELRKKHSTKQYRKRNSRTWVRATFALIGVVLLGILFWQSTSPPDVSGRWTGEDWGRVVLEEQTPGKYAGTYTDTFGKDRGTLELKWSRIERRYNGTWREGEDRFGKISVRLVDGEIRGAWTTSKNLQMQPDTPDLADLLWTRIDAAPSVTDGNQEWRETLDKTQLRIKPPSPESDGAHRPDDDRMGKQVATLWRNHGLNVGNDVNSLTDRAPVIGTSTGSVLRGRDWPFVRRTPNFHVRADNDATAAAVSQSAEAHLDRLMTQFMGKGERLPDHWTAPCIILVRSVAALPSADSGTQLYGPGSGAAVAEWGHLSPGLMEAYIELKVKKGQLAAVLSHELPREIMRLILHAWFSEIRTHPPAWSEAALLSLAQDAASVRRQSEAQAAEYKQDGKFHPLRKFFDPKNPDDHLLRLVQGTSLVMYLQTLADDRKLFQFLRDGTNNGTFAIPLKHHYGFARLEEFETAWLKWIDETVPADDKDAPRQSSDDPSEVLASCLKFPRNVRLKTQALEILQKAQVVTVRYERDSLTDSSNAEETNFAVSLKASHTVPILLRRDDGSVFPQIHAVFSKLFGDATDMTPDEWLEQMKRPLAPDHNYRVKSVDVVAAPSIFVMNESFKTTRSVVLAVTRQLEGIKGDFGQLGEFEPESVNRGTWEEGNWPQFAHLSYRHDVGRYGKSGPEKLSENWCVLSFGFSPISGNPSQRESVSRSYPKQGIVATWSIESGSGQLNAKFDQIVKAALQELDEFEAESAATSRERPRPEKIPQNADIMEPRRPADDSLPWGEPLLGLRMRLSAPRGSEYRRGARLPLLVEMQNVGDKPISLADLHPCCDFKVHSETGDWLGIAARDVAVSPWEQAEGSLAPQQVLTWHVWFDRFRLNKPVAAGSKVQVRVSVPRQIEEPGMLPRTSYSEPVFLKLIDAPQTVLNEGRNRPQLTAGDVTDRWAEAMDLVYREAGGLRTSPPRTIHIDGQGRVTLLDYGGTKVRTETRFNRDRLDQLASRLRQMKVWELSDVDWRLAHLDEGEVRISLTYGGATHVGDYANGLMRENRTLAALKAEMLSVIDDAVKTAAMEREIIAVDREVVIGKQKVQAVVDSNTGDADKIQARQTAEQFLTALLSDNPQDVLALGKQATEFRKALADDPINVATVHVNDAADKALVVTTEAKLKEPQPDGGKSGCLLLTLIKQNNNWVINDIDFESQESAEEELQRFSKETKEKD